MKIYSESDARELCRNNFYKEIQSVNKDTPSMHICGLFKACAYFELFREAKLLFEKLIEKNIIEKINNKQDTYRFDITLHYRTTKENTYIDDFGMIFKFYYIWELLNEYHEQINSDNTDDYRRMCWLMENQYQQFGNFEEPDLTQMPLDFQPKFDMELNI